MCARAMGQVASKYGEADRAGLARPGQTPTEAAFRVCLAYSVDDPEQVPRSDL